MDYLYNDLNKISGGANKLRFTEWKYTKEAISLRKLQWEGGFASR